MGIDNFRVCHCSGRTLCKVMDWSCAIFHGLLNVMDWSSAIFHGLVQCYFPWTLNVMDWSCAIFHGLLNVMDWSNAIFHGLLNVMDWSNAISRDCSMSWTGQMLVFMDWSMSQPSISFQESLVYA